MPQKRKLASLLVKDATWGWLRLVRWLPLLSFHDMNSSGKPYLVQAYLCFGRGKCDILAISRDRYIILYTESGLLFEHIINRQKNKWNVVILDDWIVSITWEIENTNKIKWFQNSKAVVYIINRIRAVAQW